MNHFINIEQNDFATFEDVDAVGDFLRFVLSAPRHGILAIGNPFGQDLTHGFLTRSPITPNHDQIQGHRTFQTGV